MFMSNEEKERITVEVKAKYEWEIVQEKELTLNYNKKLEKNLDSLLKDSEHIFDDKDEVDGSVFFKEKQEEKEYPDGFIIIDFELQQPIHDFVLYNEYDT